MGWGQRLRSEDESLHVLLGIHGYLLGQLTLPGDLRQPILYSLHDLPLNTHIRRKRINGVDTRQAEVDLRNG